MTEPIVPKRMFGNHAANTGGNVPLVPKASPNVVSKWYRKQMPMLLATPTYALCRPVTQPNGKATNTTTAKVHGCASRQELGQQIVPLLFTQHHAHLQVKIDFAQ